MNSNTLAKWETHYAPVSVGLEEMFRRLDVLKDTSSTYPPYNLTRLDDHSQRLDLALAGHSKEDIEVSVEKKVLNIKATKPAEEQCLLFQAYFLRARIFLGSDSQKDWSDIIEL